MNAQTLKPAPSQALKVLLLVCAGALLVIALTLADTIRTAQSSLVMQLMRQPAGAQSVAPHGPEADPYLRRVPGGYDYELEPPPVEMP